jgi:hypothetical protein
LSKKHLNYNIVQNKNKRKKIKINDDNISSYYHLEDKYYSITKTNNNSKNKDIHYLHKKITRKKIENALIKKIGIPSSKNSYNSIIFNKKIDCNSLKNENEDGNESKNNINKFNKNGKNKNNNRVFKNIFKIKKAKDKEISKNNKVYSLTIESFDNNTTINSISRNESVFPETLMTLNNSKIKNSRNNKSFQNTKNIKHKKAFKNCIKLQKKPDMNNDNDKLINHFYYNNDLNITNKSINSKVSYSNNNIIEQKNYSNINIDPPSKKISKKNTNIKYNTIDCILIIKNINDNKIKNSNIINKKNINFQKKKSNNNNTLNSKIISNIDGNNNSKISLSMRKNNTINFWESKNHIIKNNINNKILKNKNKYDYNSTLKNFKIKNIKLQKNKLNQNLNIINNSHFKPMRNNNSDKNSFFSLINNHIT